MSIEHKTERGSIYLEDGDKWYHIKDGSKIELPFALKIPTSTLQGILLEYNLESGGIIKDKEKFFKELKQKKDSTLSDTDYRICFAYRHKDETEFRLGYSSTLIEEYLEGTLGNSSTNLKLTAPKEENTAPESQYTEEQRAIKEIKDEKNKKDKKSRQPKQPRR